MAADPNQNVTGEPSRFVTGRSVLFGLVGIFLMAGLSAFHDLVLMGSQMVGSFIPTGAFTYFALLGLGWNGLWTLVDRGFKSNTRFRDRFALSMRELVFVTIVTLVASYPPTSGLYRYFHRMIMLPWYYVSGRPEWLTHGLLTSYLRPELFPDPWPGADGATATSAYELVYKGFFNGLAQGTEAVPLWNLPLGAWVKPMLYWGPLLLLFVLSLTCLQFLVHRKWASHEQLSYPIAQLADSFCRTKDGGRGVPLLFSNRLFWWGCLPVLLFLGLDYLSNWDPETFPPLRDCFPALRSWNLPLSEHSPGLKHTYLNYFLENSTLFFSFVGIAYFVSSEISFTFGITPIAVAIFTYAYYQTTGRLFETEQQFSAGAGAYIAYTGMLLYTGRTYFRNVFSRAFGLRRKATDDERPVDDVAILAARLLLAGMAGFLLVLSWMCQSWLMAIFFTILIFTVFFVVSRLVCETGLPLVQQNFFPAMVFIHLFGPAAVGPKPLTFILWGSGILSQDPKESLMPYVATGLKLADDHGMRLKRVFWAMLGAIVLALAIGWFSSMFGLYNYGALTDGWASITPPQSYLNEAAKHFHSLKTAGTFDLSDASSPLARLALWDGTPACVHYFFYGLAAMIVLSALRLHFSKWPVHPLLLLVMSSYTNSVAWWSFLVGWAIKQLVVRFGGGGVYMRLKPLFIGLIAGEIGMAGITILVDFAHYLIFGTPARVHQSFLP